MEKAAQYQAQQKFKQATYEERQSCQFFPVLDVETEVDHSKIDYVKEHLGITDEKFLQGRMSSAVM